MSKPCSKCGQEKSLEDFPKNSYSKDGSYSFCKTCKQQRDLAYREANRSTLRQKNKSYYDNHKVSWFTYNASRRAIFEKAKPSWLTESQKQQIDLVYVLAQECKALTGEDYHVDHIVPLRGKGVCGLHVPWNLQVLPSDINLSKATKFEGGW